MRMQTGLKQVMKLDDGDTNVMKRMTVLEETKWDKPVPVKKNYVKELLRL